MKKPIRKQKTLSTTISVHRLLLTFDDAVPHVKNMSNNISIPQTHTPYDITRKLQVWIGRLRMKYTMETHRYIIKTARAGSVHPLCKLLLRLNKPSHTSTQ
jgi:hypothetical protein